MKNSSGAAGLSHDIWYQIIQQLDARMDFRNLALVCKNLYSLAIPRLYSTIVLGPTLRERQNYRESLGGFRRKRTPNNVTNDNFRNNPWDYYRDLMLGLVENASGLPAQSVREVEILAFGGHDASIASSFDQNGMLARLVKAFPKLRHFRLRTRELGIDGLIRELNDHNNQPQLHLLEENGTRAITGSIPCVTTIQASVNPYYDTREKPNRHMLGLQTLFFACPNLKSFSLSVHGNYGGCMVQMPNHPQFYTFQLTGTEILPPLEHLSLDGYPMKPEEWLFWRDNLDWSCLKSLSLGPQPIADLLQYFTGYATNLTSFTIQAYAREAKDHCPALEAFLLSFNTLTRLTVKGRFASSRALSNHSQLRHLCLHTIEIPRDGAHRPTLDVASLNELDVNCPDLETLELDIYRDDEWLQPEDTIRTLASGFSHLRHLKLHCEVGIDWERVFASGGGRPEPLLPMLDEDLAKAFGQTFFAWRPRSMLEAITLATGEQLRRFPQWPPLYAGDERAWSRTIHIRAPSSLGGEPVIYK